MNLEAADTILQLLAYENAKADCKKRIAPFKGKATLTDHVKLCQGLGTETHKADLLAQVPAALTTGKCKGQCFSCGQTGPNKAQRRQQGKLSLRMQDTSHQVSVLNVKKEFTGQINVIPNSTRMDPAFRETYFGASLQPRKTRGPILP